MKETELFDQLTTMTKAYGYDVLAQDNEKLKEENKRLRERVKYLEDLIDQYTNKMLNQLK